MERHESNTSNDDKMNYNRKERYITFFFFITMHDKISDVRLHILDHDINYQE